MAENMKTGSMGGNAHEVSSVETTKPAKSVPDAAEQTEKQAVNVDGPSEALSADKDLEGTK